MSAKKSILHSHLPKEKMVNYSKEWENAVFKTDTKLNSQNVDSLAVYNDLLLAATFNYLKGSLANTPEEPSPICKDTP